MEHTEETSISANAKLSDNDSQAQGLLYYFYLMLFLHDNKTMEK